jgi:superfamily II DNA or RNA helicase
VVRGIGVQESHSPFSAGQRVIVRDEAWAVLSTEAFESACLLKLRGIDARNRDELQSVLAPFDLISPLTPSRRLRAMSRRGVMRSAARAIAESTPWKECWTSAAAAIDQYAWQLEPALAAISGATRILLADAVGLGKTIEAGLIIAELCARGLAERVLVLTPASIRLQWAEELRSRFGHAPVVFDQATLASLSASLPPDVNPWQTASLIVSSIDLVKRPEVRAALDGVVFDVLVVDEAHHLTPGSDRGAVVADLAARTPWVVLATATPHSGDDGAYRFLTDLGDVGTEDLRVFRRAAPATSRRRRSRVLLVTPTAAERALLDATWDYGRALAASRLPGAQLVASVIARRAASSAAAAVRTLRRRVALLSGQPRAELQTALPWEEVDVDDEIADRVLSVPGLADPHRERDWLQRLVDLALPASSTSSKLSVVRRLLRRTREQLIVFSEYRDVALEIAGALDGQTSVVAIHGGLSPRERHDAVAAFNGGGVRALVATDAAGEGLNLQARCRFVINLEIPWTPRRLEQRIGRVDRLGQSRAVHALHLAHRGSYEGTVIARLERRRARAAAAANGDELRAGDSPDLLRRRLLALDRDSGHHARAVYAASHPRRSGRAKPSDYQHDAVIMLFATPIYTATGLMVEQHLMLVRAGVRPIRRLRRQLVRSLAAAVRVDDVVRADARRCTNELQHVMTALSNRLAGRLSMLIQRLDHRASGGAWQGSLFDRRQEQAAGRHALHLAALREHLRRRHTSALLLRRLQAGDPRLAAAWLERQ